jgi:RNA polymerase sigma-70 factor (ECF subfamily)
MANDIETHSGEPPVWFHELLLTTLPSLRQQAMALTRHRADAEDLVHSAIANALAAYESFEAGTNFRAWMTRILRNRFFSNIRRQREMVDLDDAPISHLGRSGSQEENIEIQDLWRHLERLPTDQSAILMMISVQGFSYDEASEYLGVAVGTLKCRVFRARTQLQQWMLGEEAVARINDAPTKRRPKQTPPIHFPVSLDINPPPADERYALAAE